MEGYPINTDLC